MLYSHLVGNYHLMIRYFLPNLAFSWRMVIFVIRFKHSCAITDYFWFIQNSSSFEYDKRFIRKFNGIITQNGEIVERVTSSYYYDVYFSKDSKCPYQRSYFKIWGCYFQFFVVNEWVLLNKTMAWDLEANWEWRSL